MTAIYDSGVLIAADRDDRLVWADHRVRLELGVVPVTTAPVVAQVSRGPRQVQLRRLLRGCQIELFAAEQAHDVGVLLSRSGGADVVDAHVMITASALPEPVVCTSDPEDMRRLNAALAVPVGIRRV